MSGTLTMSYSKASTFLFCRQKYIWQYIEDLTPKTTAPPLKIGVVVHNLREKYNRGELLPKDIHQLKQTVMDMYPNEDWEQNEDAAYQSAKLFDIYLKTLDGDGLKLISPEMTLKKEMTEPETGTKFILEARYDALCQTPDERLWREELKTTARTDNMFLKGLRKGIQTGVSMWLADELLDFKLSGTIYTILLRQKVMDAKRGWDLRSDWSVDFAKRAINGVVRDIQRGDFYPSMDCARYNKPCEFLPLCEGGGENLKHELYQSREEVKQKSQSFEF